MAEQFVVSALKYRPQTFNTVIGQQHITTTLKNAIKNNQVAHSFLFCGPRGVGKTTCARILAKTLNCTNRTPDFEACDQCNNCLAFKDNTSYNVFELDAASNNSVEDIRHLTEQVRFAPQAGKYKVYIIDEVHMLSQAAFNAFLKTLEEPPSYAIFILATTEKHKILPTILSRCQIFDFNRIKTNDVVDHLKTICGTEHIQFEEDALHTIALKSEGCMRDALSIMDKIASFSGANITYEQTILNLNILDYDQYLAITEKIIMQDVSAVLVQYDEILARGFEGDTFLNGYAEHFRNLLLSKDSKVVKLLDITENIKRKYYIQANQLSNNYIINALSVLNQAEINYKLAKNKRLHVELALIKLCHLADAIQLLSDEEGSISKKKVINNRITPIYTKHKTAATLKIDEAIDLPKAMPNKAEQEPQKETIATISKPAGQTTQAPGTSGAQPTIGLSLSGLKKNVIQKVNAESKVQKEEIPINAENLRQNWNSIIEKIGQNSDFYIAGLKSSRITFEGNNIHLLFTDLISYERLQKQRIECIQEFKQCYHNDKINVQFELDKSIQEQNKNIKSTLEIRQEILAQHPHIKAFKDTLNLDFN